MHTNQNLLEYYHERAGEYDKVYQNPAEQADLQAAAQYFQEIFAGKKVLEIACGTGYWTAVIAQIAQSVYATDGNESLLEIARQRIQSENVRFAVADMYHLSSAEKYEAIFGGFIWSHILKQDLNAFLQQLKPLLLPNGLLVFIDSNPLENTNHDRRNISITDANGNSYQQRTLENGKSYSVLKNFPDDAFLREGVADIASEINIQRLEYYWVLKCKIT